MDCFLIEHLLVMLLDQKSINRRIKKAKKNDCLYIETSTIVATKDNRKL